MRVGFLASTYGKPLYAFRILITLFVCGCATTHPDIHPVSGFGDIAWQAPLSGVKDLSLLPKGGGQWKWAVRDKDPLMVGQVPVDKIEYIFIDDAFAGVDVDFSGYKNLSLLIRDLKDAFGVPTINNSSIKMMVWKPEGTTVMLRYYSKLNSGEMKYILDNVIK